MAVKRGDSTTGDELPRATCGSAPSLGSVPVALGVPPQRVGEIGISLTAPDGALYEIDAAAQVGESGGSRDTVDGG